MKLVRLLLCRCARLVNVHMSVKPVAVHKLVGERKAPWFHGMGGAKVVFLDAGVVVV